MGIADHIVHRIYSCTNPECKAIVKYDQKASENFKVICPLCKKDTLLLHSGHSTLSTFIDTKKPKTWGSASEQNQKQREKEGKLPKRSKKKRPYWRKSDKIDYTILRNPVKYIETGNT